MFLTILLLCATATSLVQGATHVSVTWGSTYHPYSPDDPQVPNWFNLYEQPAQSYTASYINGLVSQAGSNWVGANNYGSSTTASNVYQNSQLIQGNSAYDLLATFHVGDFYSIPNYNGNGVKHYAYYVDSQYNPGVIDAVLYDYTGAKHKFTFIWTCVNGGTTVNGVNTYGYFDSSGYAVGMPLAWTKQTTLSTNGYDAPTPSAYAYIGFENISKFLSDDSEFGPTYNYGDFCREFYYNLLVQHRTVKTSLNYAAATVLGSSLYDFADTNLYNGYTFHSTVFNMTSQCYMRVIGNGNMVLPT